MFFPRVMQCVQALMPKNVLSNLILRSESSYQGSEYAKRSLDGVIMLMRHGARTPNTTYPKDPYGGKNWAGGLGVLLPLGERQMEASGYKKAKRYGSVLPVGIENLSAVSSESPRCVRSMEKFLDGYLWKKWPNNFISVVPRSQDKFLSPKGRSCPAYMSTVLESCSFQNSHVRKYMDELGVGGSFIRYIEKSTGVKISRGIETFYHLNDLLTTQLENGYSLPSWAKPVYRDYIRPLGKFSYHQMITSDYMRIRTGALLYDIQNKIKAIATNQTRRVIKVYSAHDFTISALCHFLGIYEPCGGLPKYGACAAFEVHQNRKTHDNTEVKFFYFDDYKDKFPVQYRIQNCKKPCSFNDFVKAIRPKIVNDYGKVCSDRRSSRYEKSRKESRTSECEKSQKESIPYDSRERRRSQFSNHTDFPKDHREGSCRRQSKLQADEYSVCSDRNVMFTGDPLPDERRSSSYETSRKDPIPCMSRCIGSSYKQLSSNQPACFKDRKEGSCRRQSKSQADEYSICSDKNVTFAQHPFPAELRSSSCERSRKDPTLYNPRAPRCPGSSCKPRFSNQSACPKIAWEGSCKRHSKPKAGELSLCGDRNVMSTGDPLPVKRRPSSYERSKNYPTSCCPREPRSPGSSCKKRVSDQSACPKIAWKGCKWQLKPHADDYSLCSDRNAMFTGDSLPDERRPSSYERARKEPTPCNPKEPHCPGTSCKLLSSNQPACPKDPREGSCRRQSKPQADEYSLCSDRSGLFIGGPVSGEDRKCKVISKNKEFCKIKTKVKI